MISSQSFAQGGLVYGETLATVGDYPSAFVNPEVIAPLNKLQKILAESSSNQVLKGEFRLDGQDLLLDVTTAETVKSLR